MRISAGELRGRTIELPAGSRARPATGLVRETLMNLLTAGGAGGQLRQGPLLDLFAGSGMTGFEALSRGAPQVIFVEAEARHAAQIKRNAYKLGVEQRCKVLHCDARRCFGAVARFLGAEQLGSAFADPPFMPGFALQFLPYLGKHAQLFQPEACIVVRSPEHLPAALPGLRLIESRRGGRAQLYVYSPDIDHGQTTTLEH